MAVRTAAWVAGVLCVCLATAARSDEKQWLDANGDWGTPESWAPLGVPTGEDDVSIGRPAVVYVTDANVSVARARSVDVFGGGVLRVESGGLLVFEGVALTKTTAEAVRLHLVGGAAFECADLDVGNGAVVEIDGGAEARIGGALTVDGGGIHALVGGGVIDGNVVFAPADTIDLCVAAGGTLTIRGDVLWQGGVVGTGAGQGGVVQVGDATVTGATRIECPYTVPAGSNVTVEAGQTLSLAGSAALRDFDGTARVDGGTLELGCHAMRGHLTLANVGGEPARLTGTVTVGDADDGSAAVSVTGGRGRIDGQVTFEPTASVDVPAGSTLVLGAETTYRSGSYTGGGELHQLGAATVERHTTIATASFRSAGDVTIATGRSLRLDAHTVYEGGTYTGSGWLTQAGGAEVVGETTIAVLTYDWDGDGSAATTVGPGATFTIDSDVIDLAGDGHDGRLTVNGGTLAVNTRSAWKMKGTMELAEASGGGARLAGSPMMLTASGTLSASGLAVIEPSLTVAGRVGVSGKAGAPMGGLTVEGNYSQVGQGALEIDLRGGRDAHAAEHDVLNVGGSVSLGGRLELNWLSASGVPGSKFGGPYDVIACAGSVSGRFEEIAGSIVPAYMAGIDYGVAAGDGGRVVRVMLHDLIDGDSDIDGDVDYADYVTARDRFGQAGPAVWFGGDFDLDGDTDAADYVLLKRNFGRTVGGAALGGGPSVPEPSSLALLALAACAIAAGRPSRPAKRWAPTSGRRYNGILGPADRPGAN